jgi:hypothetical protein
MADVVIPDPPGSPVTELAAETARAFSSPAMVNHCSRSYVWAVTYATANGIEFDAELLYVSTMLHDLGLSPAFDNHRLAFETAGGHVAWVFAAGAGWPAPRRDHAARVVVDHMRDDVTPEEDAEGYLLAVATSWDISGRRPDAWPHALTRGVLERFPRLDLGTEFLRCFQDQAQRKPGSAAAAAVASGIAGRIAANPLEG